jgi:hypothetical protein
MPARTTRLAWASNLLVTLTLTAGLAACTGAPQAPPPTDVPAPPSGPAVVEPTASPTAPATPDVGPADYAAWVEIQGFGGSSGLRQVLKEAQWIQDHPTEGSAFDIGEDMRLADDLAAWLDAHDATPCWAEYHATMRGMLDRIHDAFSAAHDARAAGKAVPLEVAAQVVSESEAAFNLAAPPAC